MSNQHRRGPSAPANSICSSRGNAPEARCQEKQHAGRFCAGSSDPSDSGTGPRGGAEATAFKRFLNEDNSFYRSMSADLIRIALRLKVPRNQLVDVVQETWLK